jgi:hypothetical protein
MQPVAVMTPYTGPRPSPARRWSAPLIVAMAATALGNVVLLGLNLVERHNLARGKAGHPVSQAFFDDTLSAIRGASRITLGTTIAFAVIGIVWATKRRSRRSLSTRGEQGVEVRLTIVSRALYATFWVMLGAAFLTSELAKAKTHGGVTVDDFIQYRTFLAVGNLCRVVMWSAYIALVVKATRYQEQREHMTSPEPSPLAAPPGVI